jgi:hypothetical protein
VGNFAELTSHQRNSLFLNHYAALLYNILP